MAKPDVGGEGGDNGGESQFSSVPESSSPAISYTQLKLIQVRNFFHVIFNDTRTLKSSVLLSYRIKSHWAILELPLASTSKLDRVHTLLQENEFYEMMTAIKSSPLGLC